MNLSSPNISGQKLSFVRVSRRQHLGPEYAVSLQVQRGSNQSRHNLLSHGSLANLSRPHLYYAARREHRPLAPCNTRAWIMSITWHKNLPRVPRHHQEVCTLRYAPQIRPRSEELYYCPCGESSHSLQPVAQIVIGRSFTREWKSFFQILIGGSSRLTFASALRARQWFPFPRLVRTAGPRKVPRQKQIDKPGPAIVVIATKRLNGPWTHPIAILPQGLSQTFSTRPSGSSRQDGFQP
jgi:hypothetical protein